MYSLWPTSQHFEQGLKEVAVAFCAQPSMSFYTEVCPVVVSSQSTQHLPYVLANRASSPLSTVNQPLKRPLATCVNPHHTERQARTETHILPAPPFNHMNNASPDSRQ